LSALKAALEAANITIKKYDPTKARPVYTAHNSISVGKFGEELRNVLGADLINHPEIVKTNGNNAALERLLEEYAVAEGLGAEEVNGAQIFIPKELSHLTLNIDRSSKEAGGKRFFCTTDEELIDPGTSGIYFLDKCGASFVEGVNLSRSVIPRYMPRRVRGILSDKDEITGSTHDYFNTYIPPEWELWKRRNPKLWQKLPSKPPEEIIRMLKHLVPSKTEREYLYSWIFTSLHSRSFVYLVLCGDPGVGKNRLKLLISALHGRTNSVDGKKETFGANENKFNGQMENNTLIWFDELKYGPDMEPRMKEYQNTNIAIERKGIDTTASSEIYSSMVISNNYPRDNYLLFNSRKFAPLVLGNGPLTLALLPDEIAELSERLEVKSKAFDVEYVAQIAKWILNIGAKYIGNYPNLEYQGPKYWELAHTSMSRWQKIAVLALTVQNTRGPFTGWDESQKAFLWSKVEEALRRKKEYESKDYRDPSTVRTFFETYRDMKGKLVFEVERVSASAVHDFWIRPVGGLPTVTGRVSLNHGAENLEDLDVTAKKIKAATTLERPPGTSEFKWRKMKQEFDAIQRGSLNGKKETDDL